MKKQITNRQYNFPDADLYMQCRERIKYAHRDLTYFNQYGYTVERLKTFLNKCHQFQALPGDDELVGDQMMMTEKKNQAAEALKSSIRSVMTRVALKFSNRSGRYRKFGTTKMGDMSDPQLLFCGRRVARVARQQLDFLAETGLNETHIARVTAACQDFEIALHIQQDKIAERDIAVELRTEKGNDLYQELVALCTIGKDIWAEKDRNKYENYTLYESNNDQKIRRKEQVKSEKTSG